MNMKTSLEGRIALAVSEGVVVNPYLDSVGVWTVGIGHTKNAGPPDPVALKGKTLTIKEVMDIFEKDLAKFEERVNRLVKVPLAQHEFDALVHFDFNTGGLHRSKLLQNLNAGNKKEAWATGFHGWLKPKELKSRRDKERAMAQRGEYGSTKAPLYTADAKGKTKYSGTIDIAAHMGGSSGSKVPTSTTTSPSAEKPSVTLLDVFKAILNKLFGG